MEATRTRPQVSERILAQRDRLLKTKPTVCTERARIYTEVYQNNQDKPLIITRALALDETLRGMSISIDDGELIVGNQASKPRAAPIFPEYAAGWIVKELDEFSRRPGDAFFPTEEVKQELREICPWWQGRTLFERATALLPPLMREIHDAEIIRAEGNMTSGDGHIAVNFPRILSVGIAGYREAVARRRTELDLTDGADLRKEQFLRAVDIALDGLSAFIRRFEARARIMSAKEHDPGRKRELEAIARNCGIIAERPPEDFYQALQLVYFVQLALQIESNGHSVSLGRADQYLYPFYVRDTQAGRLSEEFARELLESTWLKIFSINKIRPWSHTRFSAGSPLYQNVTIGGQTRDGHDAVNPLSFLILESVGNLRLPQPNLSVRYHSGMSDEFLMACIRVIEKGFGMPAFKNDEIVIPALLKQGVEKTDAFDYSAIGCIEVAVPGKWGYRCTGMSFLNLPRVLLAALANGKDSMSGKTFCPGAGNLEEFESFDEVMKAWDRQVRFYARATVAIDTAVDTALEENVPDVLCSAFVDDCITRGKTLKEGGAKYDFISGLQVGIANLGNALAAIRKLVFDERRIGKAELMAALAENFEGPQGEKIRQLLVNRAPKYGNDEDSVDLLLRDAYNVFIDELSHYHNTRYGRGPIGGTYYAGTSSISANVPSGSVVPATPDGRKAFAPLAEGCSPSSGTDTLGPTAVFKSVAKLPTEKICGGVLLNQKLSPSAIRTQADKDKLAALLRTFFDDLKGWHVQYNIVSRQTLLAAQKDPESYRDLVVRVAGYSALFTTLAPETQNDIIARTEHQL
ncbi:MAG TPA: glycyl radical protein [Spirochaetia bacterium]|nr:glycyl radical protein [Spirochaetia bacterium]